MVGLTTGAMIQTTGEKEVPADAGEGEPGRGGHATHTHSPSPPSGAKVDAMDSQQAPWQQKIYRDTHGRGMRRPTFGSRLPRYRTRCGSFDDLFARQIRRLYLAWPELVGPVQFAVEDVPVSEPTPWDEADGMFSRSFPPSRGIPARIILYRMPIQERCRNNYEVTYAIREELALRLSDLYGRAPEDIDPSCAF